MDQAFWLSCTLRCWSPILKENVKTKHIKFGTSAHLSALWEGEKRRKEFQCKLVPPACSRRLIGLHIFLSQLKEKGKIPTSQLKKGSDWNFRSFFLLQRRFQSTRYSILWVSAEYEIYLDKRWKKNRLSADVLTFPWFNPCLLQVFTGGLSSYCLILMVVSFLQVSSSDLFLKHKQTALVAWLLLLLLISNPPQLHPRIDASDQAANLGVLLIGEISQTSQLDTEDEIINEKHGWRYIKGRPWCLNNWKRREPAARLHVFESRVSWKLGAVVAVTWPI